MINKTKNRIWSESCDYFHNDKQNKREKESNQNRDQIKATLVGRSGQSKTMGHANQVKPKRSAT